MPRVLSSREDWAEFYYTANSTIQTIPARWLVYLGESDCGGDIEIQELDYSNADSDGRIRVRAGASGHCISIGAGARHSSIPHLPELRKPIGEHHLRGTSGSGNEHSDYPRNNYERTGQQWLHAVE